MFGNMFSGMFGGGKMPEMQNIPDAMGQASMGAPAAMGQGMPAGGYLSSLLAKWKAMDPMQQQMMMSRIGRGFSQGMGGVASAQMPQIRQSYQPMTAPQQMQWFNPNGGR